MLFWILNFWIKSLNLCTPTSLEVWLGSLTSRSDGDYMKVNQNFVFVSKMRFLDNVRKISLKSVSLFERERINHVILI